MWNCAFMTTLCHILAAEVGLGLKCKQSPGGVSSVEGLKVMNLSVTTSCSSLQLSDIMHNHFQHFPKNLHSLYQRSLHFWFKLSNLSSTTVHVSYKLVDSRNLLAAVFIRLKSHPMCGQHAGVQEICAFCNHACKIITVLEQKQETFYMNWKRADSGGH